MKLIAGTRGSDLALAQTDIVINKIKSKYPNIEIDKKIVLTIGDRIQDRALEKIGDKGVFVSEIESMIIDGQIDFAVHSMKDMPSDLAEGLILTNTPDRDDPRDILVVNPKYDLKNEEIYSWLKNTNNLKIGTGSKRRKCQLKMINPSIQDVLIRGNINTRLKKLISEDFDAIVIAAAGINRLKIDDINKYCFDFEQMIPSPAQGALAVEIREDNTYLLEIFNDISDDASNIEVSAERSFLKHIDGGCHKPVGAIAEIDGETLSIKGIYGDESCDNVVVCELSGSAKRANELGEELARIILSEMEGMKDK